MPKNRRSSALSSLDPTNKVIAVRLPSDLLAAVNQACQEQGITQSEFLRGLVSQWVYGKTQLSGPDEGYAQARSMASQLAHVIVRQTMHQALKEAIASLPETHDAAHAMLQGYYNERSERGKRS